LLMGGRGTHATRGDFLRCGLGKDETRGRTGRRNYGVGFRSFVKKHQHGWSFLKKKKMAEKQGGKLSAEVPSKEIIGDVREAGILTPIRGGETAARRELRTVGGRGKKTRWVEKVGEIPMLPPRKDLLQGGG